MQSAHARNDVLSIYRAQVQYHVPGDHPAPNNLRHLFDRVLEKNIPSALENALGLWFDRHKNDVWLIRTLECELDLDADHEQDIVARQWAGHIATELARTVEAPDTADGVLHFPNWSAYLAHFLTDLTKGQAWSRWYYREFEGLKMLPVAAAVRTAVLDDPDTGLGALLKLGDSKRERLITALSPQEARRIVETLSKIASEGIKEPNDFFKVVLTAFEKNADFSPFRLNPPWQAVLDLFLRVTETDLRLAGHSLYRLSLALITLQQRLDSSILQALDESKLSAIYKRLGMQDGERIAPLLQRSRLERRALIQLLQAKQQLTPEQRHHAFEEPRHTEFGGLFLLFPFLDLLLLSDAVQDWLDPDGMDRTNLLRLLISAKCMGGARSIAVFNDPLLRDLLQVPPQLSLVDTANWLKTIKCSQWHNFLLTLAKRHMQESGGKWFLDSSKYNHRPVAVLGQEVKECWIAVLNCRPQQSKAFAKQLAEFFPDEIALQKLIGKVESAGGENTGAQKLQSDLEFLQAPNNLVPTQEADLALSVAAQSILRNFAHRLPGFSNSSLDYLYTNFLAIKSKVDQEPLRRVVRLARPPLNVILNMTSMTRAGYSLEWLGKLPFELFTDHSP